MNPMRFSLLVVAVVVYARYRRDIRSAREHLQSGGSQVIETGCGPVEYATFGEGHPVLVVHGIFGGYDQGLVIARGNVGERFRSIAPSRFGYLRSPLPEDASPAGQADAPTDNGFVGARGTPGGRIGIDLSCLLRPRQGRYMRQLPYRSWQAVPYAVSGAPSI